MSHPTHSRTDLPWRKACSDLSATTSIFHTPLLWCPAYCHLLWHSLPRRPWWGACKYMNIQLSLWCRMDVRKILCIYSGSSLPPPWQAAHPDQTALWYSHQRQAWTDLSSSGPCPSPKAQWPEHPKIPWDSAWLCRRSSSAAWDPADRDRCPACFRE